MQMEGRESSSVVNMKNQIVPPTIKTALVSAVLEWFLIFLLFIDASFSYMVTKFARYCQLQIPCLLCSRLDHVLGKEKEGFYWDLVCRKHKLKISSLVLCHLHDKLVDVHGMCESCLFSFATVNKSNAETYRLLVGKLGDELHLGLDPNSLLSDDPPNSSNGRKCACCNVQFISRGEGAILLKTKAIRDEVADFGAPLVATNRHDRVEPKEFTDVLSQRVITFSATDPDIDHLPHIKYQKVKITSDTESIGYEVADSSEPLLVSSGHDKDELKEFIELSSQEAAPPSLSRKDDIDSLPHIEYEKVEITSDTESIGYEAADLDAPLLVTNGHERNSLKDLRDVSSQKVKAFQAGKNDIDHLPHVEYEKVKINSDTESEAYASDENSTSNPVNVINDENQNASVRYREKDLIVGDLGSEKVMNPSDVSQPSNLDSEVHAEASDLHAMAPPATIGHGLEELNWQHVEHKEDDAVPELISFSDTFPSSNSVPSSANMPEENFNFKGGAELEKEAVKEYYEMAELASNLAFANEKQSELKSSTSDTSSQITNLLELGDAYKLAVGSRGRQFSGKLLEQKSFKDSTRVSADLKLLLSQLSAARGIELQLNDMSPRVSGNIDELRNDASGSIGIQILQKRISLERNESGISLDGSTLSEIEGESVVDRLKRQVEHDKKLMGALYKELEEERNASAVAANQAMAMITRLQEEKATFHMEALQCLRMMEEQAEYDAEALQKANDLLAEKEKVIQDLEAELETCKKKLGYLSPTANEAEPTCGFNIQEISVEELEASLAQKNTTLWSFGDIVSTTCRKANDTAISRGDQNIYSRTSLAFEDESLHILQCLKELQRKLELFSNPDYFPDTANGNFSKEEKVKVAQLEQLSFRQDTLENDEETDFNLKNTVNTTLQNKDSEHENRGIRESGQLSCRDVELDALRDEFLALNDRLKALEAEYSFLEQSMRSLSKGDEGLKLIQEIACQIRGLHSIGIKRRN